MEKPTQARGDSELHPLHALHALDPKKPAPESLKRYRNSVLLQEVRNMLDAGGKRVTEADILLQVLATRKLSSHRRREYEDAARLFRKQTKLCRMSSVYSGEFVGVKFSPDQQVPTHVYGAAILKVWKRWKRTKKDLAFPEYFERYATNKEFAKAQRNQIRYLNAEEQKECEVTFSKKGELRKKTTKKRFRPGHYMFVLLNDTGKDGRLLLAKKRRGKTHHSSLSQGRACFSAGMMRISPSAHLVVVHMDSGHYKPGHQHSVALMRFLEHPSRLGRRARKVAIQEHQF
jgi:hypothetical protein